MTNAGNNNPVGPTSEPPKPEPIEFSKFLESVSPSKTTDALNVWTAQRQSGGTGSYNQLSCPDIELYCTGDDCDGLRYFRFQSGDTIFPRGSAQLNTFLTYLCANCQTVRKIFSLHVIRKENDSGQCYKYGEIPPYGPPTPARLLRLVDKDKNAFLKGRRSETQGLGIGAFAYYRRVVENHKDQIVGEIIRVAKQLDASTAMISILEKAKEETQFSKAIELVKDAIPQALLINGQNPLTLLHSALSAGIHEDSDEKCLELAHDIRVVLIELTERLALAVKDEAELNSAVSRLIKKKQKPE
jgi:hypothetical protein